MGTDDWSEDEPGLTVMISISCSQTEVEEWYAVIDSIGKLTKPLCLVCALDYVTGERVEIDIRRLCLPSVIHFSFTCMSVQLDNTLRIRVKSLSSAHHSGDLSQLTHLTLQCYRVPGCFAQLFGGPWPSLTCLDLWCSALDHDDLDALGSAVEGGLMPRLESVSLHLPKDSDDTVLTKHVWRGVQSFSVRTGPAGVLVREENFPNLNTMCGSSGRYGGESVDVSVERWRNLKNLHTNLMLTTPGVHVREIDVYKVTPSFIHDLCDGILDLNFLSKLGIYDSEDPVVDRLSRLSSEDKLPALRHLGIINRSKYHNKSVISRLFNHSCTWDQLHSLGLYGCNDINSWQILCRQAEAGCLQNLQELMVGDKPGSRLQKPWRRSRPGPFHRLRKLIITFPKNQDVVEMVEEDFFPVLETLKLHEHQPFSVRRRLGKKGVQLLTFAR